ncbi:MAG: hypothetical protein JNJ85_09355, partial [Candidatus Kapabacteria bacterium]|nr:hypothetical protein [Candidatus Kapabacteria bacterium]
MFFYINSNLFGADPTITNVKAEVLKHDDETQYVKITYTAKDFPAAGAVVKFSALCIGSTLFTLKPTSSEISGDIGLITSDGAKTILWEDELTLIRTNLQDKYLCNALLSIEGNESSVSEVALNVSKYKESTWYYFATGQLQMQIEKIVGGEPQFSCSTLGNEWHHEAIAAGATFYKVSSVNLPVYKGRNPGDKFKGTVDRNTCSAFLAIKDYGKSTQKIWANFARQFVQTNDINGTNITQDFEFQFRYTEDSKTGAKSLSVGNAGKQGQQIYSELNIGEIMDITLYTGVIGQVKSNEFEINVPRREWKYVYKGKHIFTVKTTDKKAKFVGGLLEHHIYLDGGTEVVIGDALKFVQVASLSIDTTIDNSKINFDGKCLMNGVEVFNLPLTTLRLNDSLLFSSPVPMGMGAAAYFLAGIAPIFDRIRVIGDPNSPTEALADIRLIFKTFSDGCDIILHPSDNTCGVVFRDMKITSNG